MNWLSSPLFWTLIIIHLSLWKKSKILALAPIIFIISFVGIFRPLTKLILQIPFVPVPINEVMGPMGYFAQNKTSDILATFFYFACCLLLGLFCVWLEKKWLPLKNQEFLPKLQGELRPKKDLWWLVILWIALSALPIFKDILTSTSIPSSFDQQNIFMWNALKNLHFQPLLDFWYPYAHLDILQSPVLPNLYWLYFHHAFIVFCVIFGSYLLLQQSFLVTLVLLIFTLLFHSSWAIDIHRYIFSAALFLLSSGVLYRKSWKGLYALFFGYAYLFWLEPHLAFYFILGFCVLVIGLNAEPRHHLLRHERLRWSVLNVFYIVIASFFIWIIFQMENFWEPYLIFLNSQKVMFDYGAMPAPLLNWFSPEFSAPNVLWLLWGYLAFLGILQISIQKDFLERWGGWLALGIALFLSPILMKQVIRSNIHFQVVAIPLVFLLLNQLLSWHRWDYFQRGFFGLGLGVQLFLLHPSLSPLSFQKNLTVLTQWTKSHSQLNEETYKRLYSTSAIREELAPQLLATLDEVFQNNTAQLYAFNTSPLIYLAYQQRPPYNFNIYNISPYEEQYKLVQWLKNNSVEFVLWNPQLSKLDNVPYTVRFPILMEELTSSYLPYKYVNSDLHILRRRKKPELPALQYWLQHLGHKIDLETVPQQSGYEMAKTCSKKETNCDEVLVITLPEKGDYTIELQYSQNPFKIHFKQKDEKSKAYIALKNLWIWPLLLSDKNLSLVYPPSFIATDSRIKIQKLRYPISKAYLY